MKGVLCLIVGLVLSVSVFGQVRGELQQQQLLERIAEELVEMGFEGEMEGVVEHLERMARQPLDINTAGRGELEDLMLLTDFQIASLLEYRNSSGYILSASELQLLNGFDARIVGIIKPFVRFGRGNMDDSPVFGGKRGADSLKFGDLASGEMLVKGWWKRGDNNFIGPNYYTQVKYKFTYGDRWQAGLLLEKDNGEKVMSKGVPLGDFSSFHLNVNGIRLGERITVNAILGDYVVRMGQGLTMWRGFMFAGSTNVQGGYKRGSRLAPYTSSDENNFNRGGAASVKLGLGKGRDVVTSIFFSLKSVDARIVGDKFTSLPTDGLHNTESTLKTRKTLGEIIYGANLQYRAAKLRLGVNWIGYGYDAFNGRRVQEYNKHQIFQGQYGNVSIDACAVVAGKRVFAELAADYGSSMAFIGGVVCREKEWDICCTFRTYSRSYIAPYAGAFSTVSSCSNQTGVSLSAGRYLNGGILCGAGVDYTYHPWVRYNIGEPSHTAKLWYRMENGEGGYQWNAKVYGNWDSYKSQYKVGIKGALGYPVMDWMKLKIRGEVASTCLSTVGGAIGAEAVFAGSGEKIRLVLRCAYYNCREWNNRIYMYEYDLPSSFASSLMYGEGMKCYLLLNYKSKGRMEVCFKADDQLKVKLGLKMRFFL